MMYSVRTREDAIKLIDVALPKLVIPELSLHNMSGVELLYHLKHTPAMRDMPVIIHAAMGDEKWEDHCRTTGCAAFLRKPKHRDELYCAIQRATEDRLK